MFLYYIIIIPHKTTISGTVETCNIRYLVFVFYGNKSAPQPSFMTIYFNYYTVINARLLYAEVRRCAGSAP